MKYLFLLLSLFLLKSSDLIGQPQYSINLDFAPGKFDRLNNIVPFEEDFIVMTEGIGYGSDSTTTQDGLVARIDSKGQILWENRIYSEYQNAHISSIGNLLVHGNQIFGVYPIINFSGNSESPKLLLFSIDADGSNYDDNIIQLNSTYAITSNLIEVDDKIILGLMSEDNQHIFFEINTDLTINKENAIPSGVFLSSYAEHLNSDNKGHIIHSYSYYDQLGFTKLKISEYDSDMNLVKEFGGLKTNEFLSDAVTIATEDNGYMVAWNKDMSHTLYDTFPYPSAIYKLDSMFNVEWEYVFVHRGAKQFSNFSYAGDGKYLGCGASDFLSITDYDPHPIWTYNAWAFLINEDGTLDWEKQIFDTRYTHSGGFFDGIKTEFGYAFVGALDTIKTEPSPYLNDPDSWYFTLDENGCWNGNCNTFIFIDSENTSYTYVSTNEIPFQEKIKAYPNPSNGILTIENENSGERKLSLYNMAGTKLLEQMLYARKSTIDLSGLSNGIYFVHVKDNKGRLLSNQKIIVQH